MKAIRDPPATGTGKTVAAGRAARRAERAAEDARDAAGKIIARDVRSAHVSGENFPRGVPCVFRGALCAPRCAPRHDRLPCTRGPGSRIAFVNVVLPFP